MGDPIQEYRTGLTQIQELLNRGSLLSLEPAERQALLGDSQKLLQKIDVLGESFLTVGLLGGTGVGKSSLMNALAGREIASTSHRRPHTEQVLIYCHETVPLPSALQKTTVPWSEIRHDAGSVRQIILCDLPDFDSLVGEHRRHVLSFLEHLDVLLWVTSPEKYADGRFYDFLRDVPKAHENYYFILNKVDLFFGDQTSEGGYDSLVRVTGRFQEHLSENGIAHPLIYAVSVRDAAASGSSGPWNQFPALRNQIFQQRDIKEVLAIKAANLDVEIQQFFLVLEKEILYLESFRQALKEMVVELEEGRSEWIRTAEESLEHWIEQDLKSHALSWLSDASCLVGPGYGIALLMSAWQKKAVGNNAGIGLPDLFREEGSLAPMRRQLQRWEDRMANRLLRRGLPAAFTSELEEKVNAEGGWDVLTGRMHRYVQMRLSGYEKKKFRGFLAMQYGGYFLVFLGFLLSLGGETWSGILKDPGWAQWVDLVSHMTRTIFSPVGLAALGSFLLLQLFLGLRFYGRYKKSLQRRAQKFIDSLKFEVKRIYKEEFDLIINCLVELDREVEAEISLVSVLPKRD